MRRRFGPLLVMVVLLLAAGCGGTDEDGGETDPTPPSDTGTAPVPVPDPDPDPDPDDGSDSTLDVAIDAVTDVVDSFVEWGNGTDALSCPETGVFAQGTFDDHEEEVGTCAQLALVGQGYGYRVQNRASTAMRLGHQLAGFYFVLEPGQYVDVPLGPGTPGSTFYTIPFSIDAASVVSLTLEHFVPSAPAADFLECIGDVSPSCVLDLAGQLDLPAVSIGGRSIDFNVIVSAASTVFDYAETVDQFQDITPRSGTLTVAI